MPKQVKHKKLEYQIMKQFIKVTFFLLVTFLPIMANAHDFEIDGIYYNIINNNEVEVTNRNNFCSSYYGEITIPETVIYNGNSYFVTAIDDEAFRNCTQLTNVEIPNSVTSIGDFAFEDCFRLTSLNFPDFLTSIGICAFSFCI